MKDKTIIDKLYLIIYINFALSSIAMFLTLAGKYELLWLLASSGVISSSVAGILAIEDYKY